MPLPKVKLPLFELTVPSTKETHLFRPYVGAEEKILLIAKESGEAKDIVLSLKQVIQNCCQSEIFDADTLCTFDVEYLFLKLRAKSVDNVVTVAYLDDEELDKFPEDEITPYEFNIDLNEVNMLQETEVKNIIQIDDSNGMVMKYPSMKEIHEMPTFKDQGEELGYLIKCCIKEIFDEETVYPITEYSDAELNEFIDSLPIPVITEMKAFLQSMPKMFYELKYTNKLGNERTITLRALSDFFTLR